MAATEMKTPNRPKSAGEYSLLNSGATANAMSWETAVPAARTPTLRKRDIN
jgi:hypothetical protein